MRSSTLVILVLLFISCNQPKNNKSKSNEPIQPQKKEFIVTFEFKSNSDGDLKLMMNNIIIDEFQKKNIHIIEKIVANSRPESLTANFGENFSYDFKINLGNEKPKEIEVVSMIVSYGQKEIAITPQNIEDFFAVNNKYISYDQESGILITKRIEGNHFPSIIMRRKVLEQLAN